MLLAVEAKSKGFFDFMIWRFDDLAMNNEVEKHMNSLRPSAKNFVYSAVKKRRQKTVYRGLVAFSKEDKR